MILSLITNTDIKTPGFFFCLLQELHNKLQAKLDQLQEKYVVKWNKQTSQ